MPLFSLFLFEKFLLFEPPWSKQAPGLSHSPAWLSPKNPAADSVPWPGALATLVPALVPGTLLSLNTLLTLPDLSMSSIFGLQSSYMLYYCWLFALLLRSARCFTGIEGKWTLLPPMLRPSSSRPNVCIFLRPDSPGNPPLPAQDCTALCYCFRLKSGKGSKAAKRLGNFLQTE